MKHINTYLMAEKAKVNLVGDFEPIQFGFQDETYWQEKGVKVSSFE